MFKTNRRALILSFEWIFYKYIYSMTFSLIQ